MSRWFSGTDSEIEWRNEKEPTFMHRAPERVVLRESPAFDPRVCTACNEPARDCTCCKFCNEPAVAVRLCAAHHQLTAERERAESITQAMYLAAQIGMLEQTASQDEAVEFRVFGWRPSDRSGS